MGSLEIRLRLNSSTMSLIKFKIRVVDIIRIRRLGNFAVDIIRIRRLGNFAIQDGVKLA